MGGVLVDKQNGITLLDDDIGAQHLADDAVIRWGRHGGQRLLRLRFCQSRCLGRGRFGSRFACWCSDRFHDWCRLGSAGQRSSGVRCLGRLRGRALNLAVQGRRALGLLRKGLQDTLGRGGGRRLPPHAGKGAIRLGGHRLEAGLGRGRLCAACGLGLCRHRRCCLGQMHLHPARRPVQRRQNAVADAVADSPLG